MRGRLKLSHLSALLVFGVAPFLLTAQSHPTNTTAMASHYGHGTPALVPMTAIDGKLFSVEAFQGHWTLLYFWADWCIPCIQHGIPDLASFAQSHKADKDRFRIVGIRFNSTSESGDFADFQKKTQHLEQSLWHKTPPFPLVYDSSTQVTTNWGVHELPTTALIDPKGNLVANGSLEMLSQALVKQTE